MNASLIRHARLERGIGVRELARLAHVTPGAVTQWEQSEMAGLIREATLSRALAAMNTSPEQMRRRAEPNFQNRLARREDRVSLELHREVAKKVVANPELALARITDEARRVRPHLRGSALQQLDEWVRLCNVRRLDLLITLMLGTDPNSINMRQISPLGAILSETERREAIGRATE